MSDDNMGDVIAFIERLESLNQGFTITDREFDLGNVVFQPMSFSEYRAYKPYPLRVKKYSGFEWECVTMPAGPNGDNISKLDTLLIGMNENTGNTEYAWKLIKILTGDSQIQSEIFDYSEGVSVLKNITRSENTLRQLMESSGEGGTMNLRVLDDAVENAVVISRFRNYDQAVEQVDQAIRSIIENSSNISMGQIVWNREINSSLKSNQ